MSDTTILQNSTHVIKPKKSVALSGVPAGNTALCTVGKSGNDLHYRGYDILDLAEHCEFEEVAHLLIHGKLPTRDELAAYKTKLKALRGLPANVRTVLEALPAASHPMDVMRTGVSALGCTLPEKEGHTVSGARDIADKLLASLSSILLYWYHYSHNGERIQPETDDDSIGGHFLHLLHGEKPSQSWEKAMHISLVLYAEHEFNASTFTSRVIAGTGSDMYSAIIGAIGALRGPKHGGPVSEWHEPEPPAELLSGAGGWSFLLVPAKYLPAICCVPVRNFPASCMRPESSRRGGRLSDAHSSPSPAGPDTSLPIPRP